MISSLSGRHAEEDVFGVQVAGSHVDSMRRLAKVLHHETSTDFVVQLALLPFLFFRLRLLALTVGP